MRHEIKSDLGTIYGKVTWRRGGGYDRFIYIRWKPYHGTMLVFGNS